MHSFRRAWRWIGQLRATRTSRTRPSRTRASPFVPRKDLRRQRRVPEGDDPHKRADAHAIVKVLKPITATGRAPPAMPVSRGRACAQVRPPWHRRRSVPQPRWRAPLRPRRSGDRMDVGSRDSRGARYEVRRGDGGPGHGRKRAEWAAAYLCIGQRRRRKTRDGGEVRVVPRGSGAVGADDDRQRREVPPQAGTCRTAGGARHPCSIWGTVADVPSARVCSSNVAPKRSASPCVTRSSAVFSGPIQRRRRARSSGLTSVIAARLSLPWSPAGFRPARKALHSPVSRNRGLRFSMKALTPSLDSAVS